MANISMTGHLDNKNSGLSCKSSRQGQSNRYRPGLFFVFVLVLVLVLMVDIFPGGIFDWNISRMISLDDTSAARSTTRNTNTRAQIMIIPGIDETVWPKELMTAQQPLSLYLEGTSQAAGLGHSWMSFNHLVRLAVNNSLTLGSSFSNGRGHGIRPARCQAYMLGDILMAPVPAPLPLLPLLSLPAPLLSLSLSLPAPLAATKSAQQVPQHQHQLQLQLHQQECNRTLIKNAKELTQEVQRVRARQTGAMASAGGCVVFVMNNLSPSENDVGRFLHNYRRIFEYNEERRRTVIQRRVVPPNDGPVIHVSVHIRRGDLFNYLNAIPERSVGSASKAAQTEFRLVPLSGYIQVMKQLLRKLHQDYGIHRVHFTLFCEGGIKPPAILIDADESYVDLLKAMTSFVDDATYNVTFGAGNEVDAIQAFDDMCFSDVLLTGASGLSHLVSLLCSKPLVLAAPFWHSYDYIPNAILLDVKREPYKLPNINMTANLITEMHFDGDRFDALWRTKEMMH